MTLALPIINLKKKLQEPWVEMAKRIIRPFRPQTPSGSQVKLERQMQTEHCDSPSRAPAQFDSAPPGPTKVLFFPVPCTPCQDRIPTSILSVQA